MATMLQSLVGLLCFTLASCQSGVSSERSGDDYRAPSTTPSKSSSDKVLVLGGQGLAGSATLNALLEAGFKVSAVNDNKDYYDYNTLFEDKIENVACMRSAGLDGCFELLEFFKSNSKVRAVVDFTSSKQSLMEEATRVLKTLNPDVYVFVSAAAVYDVSKDSDHPLKEEYGVRPEGREMQHQYSQNNKFGDNMLGAEEALVASGIPYVIMRCGDLIGPRDTTYRWWQYQVWAEHFDIIDSAFPVPEDLKNLVFSMTYGEDVAQAVVSAIRKKVSNEVYNVALEKSFTLPHLLLEMCAHFGQQSTCFADFTQSPESYKLYPSSHQGTLNIEKAKRDLDFKPSEWETVLKETMKFYEEGRGVFTAERDTILTRLNENIVPYLKIQALNDAVTRTEVEVIQPPVITRTEL